MKKISKMIILEDKLKIPLRKRKTVRGIILNHDKILLVYSSKYDDYLFPGGGFKGSERKIKALKRELQEELGCKEVTSVQAFGYIKESRISARDQVPFVQKSFYYLCEISGEGEQKLEEDEIEYGVIPTWINIDEAIIHNSRVVDDEAHQKIGIRTVLHREIVVLKKIKEMLEDEKI